MAHHFPVLKIRSDPPDLERILYLAARYYKPEPSRCPIVILGCKDLDHNMGAWNAAAGINLRAAPGDSLHTLQLGCPMHRRRAYSASLDDGRASLSTNRSLDTATHLVRARGREVNYILQN
jgi:hypothetical protein